MTPPYYARIVACLPNHSPVELARFTDRKMFPHDYRSHTAELSPEWTAWAEYPLSDKQCVSDRPKIKQHYSGSSQLAFHLSREQKIEAKVRADL